MRKAGHLLLIFSSLAGCATGAPVAVTYRDHSLSGVGRSSADMSNFSFTVSDNAVACSGQYDMRAAFVPAFTFPISCSDGRTGRVEARREPYATDKAQENYPIRGKVIFSDGKVGMFNLGADARYLNEHSLTYQNYIESLSEQKFK